MDEILPDPSYWHSLVDEFNRTNDLLPPTHPHGQHRAMETQVPVPDEVRHHIDQQRDQGRAAFEAMAKPPTERGWVPTTGTPIQDAIRRYQAEFVLRKTPISPSGKSWRGQWVALDAPEVDRTFENEVRPS